MESAKEPVTREPIIKEPAITRKHKPRGVDPFLSTLGIAVLIATLFTAWTPNSLFTSNLSEQLRMLLTPQAAVENGPMTPLPQIRIGIVAARLDRR